MTALADIMAADLREAEAEIPQTVAVGGQSVACVAGDWMEGVAMGGLEGLSSSSVLPITVRLAVLTAAGVSMPGPGAIIVFQGRNLRIQSALVSPDGISVTWHCEDETQ
jgi:hypothetical protein